MGDNGEVTQIDVGKAWLNGLGMGVLTGTFLGLYTGMQLWMSEYERKRTQRLVLITSGVSGAAILIGVSTIWLRSRRW